MTDARARLHAALNALLEVGDLRSPSVFQAELANVDLGDGHPEQALERLDRSETLLREVGDPAHLAVCLAVRARVLWQLGRADDARAALAHAEAVAPFDHPESDRALYEARADMGAGARHPDTPGEAS